MKNPSNNPQIGINKTGKKKSKEGERGDRQYILEEKSTINIKRKT